MVLCGVGHVADFNGFQRTCAGAAQRSKEKLVSNIGMQSKDSLEDLRSCAIAEHGLGLTNDDN
eukprot:2598403-Rhodomonas_salina.1